VREVLSSFRFLNSTYPRSKALPWNALTSRLRLALAILLQLRRQEPPLHCVPRRSQGTSAKNRKEPPVFSTCASGSIERTFNPVYLGDKALGIRVDTPVPIPARRASFEVALFRASQSWNPYARWLFRARARARARAPAPAPAPARNRARVSPFDDEHEQDEKPHSATSKRASQGEFC
jgi:hypothetical protein